LSRRSRKRQKRSFNQIVLYILSAFLAASMIVSLIIVALPGPPAPTPTSLPTWTALPPPTATPTPLPPEPSPTVEATEPVLGPAPATGTPVLTPTLTITPAPTLTPTVTPTPTLTATPTLTITPSTASPALTFAVCGDSRNGPQVYRRVLDSVMADGSEFLVHTGDLVNSSTEAQWQEFQETMAGFTLPFYPVAGNHDSSGGQLDDYLAYTGAPAAHYSFDREPVHFALADSHNGGISAGELAWLRDDLSAAEQPIKMVFLHHPPFDPDGTDHIMAYGNEPFMDLMVEQDVDYVFTGHIHAYVQGERDGVLYILTGGAGAPLYTADHPQAFHHYLRVTVQDQQVIIEVIKV
jgi:predicted phosphodiesterase